MGAAGTEYRGAEACCLSSERSVLRSAGAARDSTGKSSKRCFDNSSVITSLVRKHSFRGNKGVWPARRLSLSSHDLSSACSTLLRGSADTKQSPPSPSASFDYVADPQTSDSAGNIVARQRSRLPRRLRTTRSSSRRVGKIREERPACPRVGGGQVTGIYSWCNSRSLPPVRLTKAPGT
jgi:hypothetical protein